MIDHQFPVSGPIKVNATIRGSDLDLTAADVTEATVRLEPLKDNGATRRLLEEALVEFVGGVLRIELPRIAAFGFNVTAPALRVRVTVPTDSDLHVSSGSGDVHVTGDLGDVVVRTGSGDAVLAAVATLNVASGSGDVSVSALTDGDFKTGSGDVTVGAASGSVQFKSGSGDLRVERVADLTATPASGDVQLGEFAGVAKVRTASGDVVIRRAVRGALEAVSASGDIVLGIAPGTAVLLDCSSASGRARTELDASDAPDQDENTLEVRARSASGDILVKRSA